MMKTIYERKLRWWYRVDWYDKAKALNQEWFRTENLAEIRAAYLAKLGFKPQIFKRTAAARKEGQ